MVCPSLPFENTNFTSLAVYNTGVPLLQNGNNSVDLFCFNASQDDEPLSC
jgi:hypothetical protein